MSAVGSSPLARGQGRQRVSSPVLPVSHAARGYLPLSKVMVGGKTDRVGSAAVIDLIVRGNITLNFLHLWGAGCLFFFF